MASAPMNVSHCSECLFLPTNDSFIGRSQRSSPGRMAPHEQSSPALGPTGYHLGTIVIDSSGCSSAKTSVLSSPSPQPPTTLDGDRFRASYGRLAPTSMKAFLESVSAVS